MSTRQIQSENIHESFRFDYSVTCCKHMLIFYNKHFFVHKNAAIQCLVYFCHYLFWILDMNDLVYLLALAFAFPSKFDFEFVVITLNIEDII